MRRPLALAEEQPRGVRGIAFALKLVLSAALIAAASELAKRSVLAGALVVSLPLSSLIALTFLQLETGDTARVASMSTGIFWMVLPSLLLLAVLPALLRRGWGYWPALGVSCAVMACAYAGYAALLRRWGIAL